MNLLSGTAAVLFFPALASAAVPIDGLYSSLEGGFAYLPGNVHAWHNGLQYSNSSYKPGYQAGGTIGYKNNPMRYEGEITYLDAALNHFQVNHIRQTGLTGYNNGILAMVNAIYDCPVQDPLLQPFLGVGIGYGWINTQINSTGPSGITRFSEAGSVFAWQALAGMSYNFAENYSLSLAYRYVATEKLPDQGDMFQAHMAVLGITYRYDESNYK